MDERGGILEEPLILQRILSFLTTKEAAKTSLLSKAWLEAWRTRPTLEFLDEELFRTDNSALTNYIHTTIQRYSARHIRIDKLKLKLVRDVVPKCVVRESIRTAIENNVRTIDLHFHSYIDNVLGIKENVFIGKSIVNLILCACALRTLSVDQIMCRNIKTLNFHKVYLDELMFENIISSCPLLESLRIRRACCIHTGDVDGPEVFRVKKHSNLQEIGFELLQFQSLILGDLPKLEWLGCHNDPSYLADVDLSFVDWMPCGFFLHSSFRNQIMKTLMLSGVGIDDSFFDNFRTKFPNVEDLCIEQCRNLRIVKLSSPSIKRITLSGNVGWEEAHFDVPGIVYFEYWDWGDMPLLSFTPVVSRRWVSFVKANWSWSRLDNLWFRELKGLLLCLAGSKISLEVTVLKGRAAFNLDEIRDLFVPYELVMVEELSIDFFGDKESRSLIVSLLDGLFGIFRPKILCQCMRGTSSLEPLYKILVPKRNQCQVQFWETDINDLQVWTYKRDYVDEVPGLLQIGDEVLNWQGILESERSITGVGGICYTFEWLTPDTPRAAKRLKVTSDTPRAAKRLKVTSDTPRAA